MHFRTVRPMAMMCLAAILAAAGLAGAEDPFSVSSRATDGSAVRATASDSDLLELTENLIRARGNFAALDGRPFTGTAMYAGIADAARFDSNAAGTRVTLTLPSTGFSRAFTGSSRKDVANQIEDFFKRDGADEWAKFLERAGEISPVAVTDGNPQATTAIMADESFRKFGKRPSLFMRTGDEFGGGNYRIDTRGGVIDADDFKGWSATISGTWMSPINDRVGFSLGSLLNYRDVEGAAIANAGVEVGLPIAIVPAALDAIFSWQVTPFANAAVSGSTDFVAGGMVVGGGVASLLSAQFGAFTVSMGNQFSYHRGIPIDAGDWRFETEVEQKILKNGLQASYGNKSYVEASVTHTHFLDDAAVKDYWTPGLAFGWRFGQVSGLRIGYSADLGDGYTMHSGNFMIYFGW